MKRTKGPKCKCGCGTVMTLCKNGKRFRKFAPGHYWKWADVSTETRKKISESRKGIKLSEEHKRRISEGGTGLKRTDETKRRISEALKMHQYDPERIKLLNKNKFDATGRKWSEEVKRKISKSNKGKHKTFNEQNPNWKGGVSFLPYPPEWKESLKKKTKKRDNYQCQNPACNGDVKTLTIHHIDYIKSNCSEFNLITLCISCNSKANSDRELWKEFYNELIEDIYNV